MAYRGYHDYAYDRALERQQDLAELAIEAEKDILADDDLVLELLSDQIWRDNEDASDQKALASAIRKMLKGDYKDLQFLMQVSLERKAEYMAGEQMAEAA